MMCFLEGIERDGRRSFTHNDVVHFCPRDSPQVVEGIEGSHGKVDCLADEGENGEVEKVLAVRPQQDGGAVDEGNE